MRAIVVASLAVLLGVSGVNWPAFKGPAGSGVAEGTAPERWDAERSINIRWKADVPGVGHSSPIVWGDRVYVTTAVPAGDAPYSTTLTEDMRPADDRQPYSWRVLCFDARSGTRLWERTIHEGVPASQRHTLNSFATPTPVTNGTQLVVYLGSEGLFALDMDGRVLWKKDLGKLDAGFSLDTTLQWGIASSPVIYKDLVVIQADVDRTPFLSAYALATGERQWTVARQDGQSWSTPAIYTGAPADTLVTIAPKSVRGYDPASGRELWKLRWKLDIVLSTPTVANGLIYVASGKGDTQPIIAIKPTARGDITLPVSLKSSASIAWRSLRGGPIVTSPLVYGEWLYALTDLGVLRCFSAATGTIKYQQRMPESFLGSPVAADGKIYLSSADGNVYVVAAGPEYRLLSTNAMGEPIAATPAFTDGTIIIRTLHHLFAAGEIRSH